MTSRLPAIRSLCKNATVPRVRVTLAVLKVFRIFLEDPALPHHGYELMKLSGFSSGKLYPLLARLQTAGWLTREHEDIDPAEAGRPRRYMYRITPTGINVAVAELSALQGPVRIQSAQLPHLRPENGVS